MLNVTAELAQVSLLAEYLTKNSILFLQVWKDNGTCRALSGQKGFVEQVLILGGEVIGNRNNGPCFNGTVNSKSNGLIFRFCNIYVLYRPPPPVLISRSQDLLLYMKEATSLSTARPDLHILVNILIRRFIIRSIHFRNRKNVVGI